MKSEFIGLLATSNWPCITSGHYYSIWTQLLQHSGAQPQLRQPRVIRAGLYIQLFGETGTKGRRYGLGCCVTVARKPYFGKKGNSPKEIVTYLKY